MAQQMVEPQNFYQEQLMEGYDHLNDPQILQQLHNMQANVQINNNIES